MKKTKRNTIKSLLKHFIRKEFLKEAHPKTVIEIKEILRRW